MVPVVVIKLSKNSGSLGGRKACCVEMIHLVRNSSGDTEDSWVLFGSMGRGIREE